MTREQSTEEPCAAKVASTVLETSGRSDPLTEFAQAIRPAVLWRKNSFGTQSLAGSLFVARIMTVVMTLRSQQRNPLDYMVQACQAYRDGKVAPSLLPKASLLHAKLRPAA